ncbi:MAG: phosphate ABC transporter permease subunit PstC [Mariprofundales bacterium]
MHAALLMALVGSGAMLGFLLYAALPFWQTQGISVLWQREWYPYESLYGMLPALIGSLWSVGLALLLAVPSAVAAAVVAAEIVTPSLRTAMRLAMELLAGIPSVVYGLLGLWFLLPWLEHSLDLLTGHSLLAAGILLAMMMVPTIMVLSLDAIAGVATPQRQAAQCLGLDWSQRLWKLLLPQAWPGIRAAILLATGRALGETMAVMLVVGSIDRLPQPWYNLLQPAQTLTSRIGREIGEAAFGSQHFAALIACGMVLALIALAVTGLAHLSVRPTTQS